MNDELGLLMADLLRAKRIKAEHNAEIKLLNAEIRGTEHKLLIEMQNQNLNKISSEEGTVYIARKTVPHVVNWDLFYEYIREHNYFHMLERRPSVKAFEEQYEQGQRVPGVDPIVFDEVRTRKT